MVGTSRLILSKLQSRGKSRVWACSAVNWGIFSDLMTEAGTVDVAETDRDHLDFDAGWGLKRRELRQPYPNADYLWAEYGWLSHI